VTVKLKADPASAFEGALMKNCDAAAGLTVMGLELPGVSAPAASMAVMVWPEAVFKVTEKVPFPFDKGEGGGSTARGSELEKSTVPA
jgi:hypothetical protein